MSAVKENENMQQLTIKLKIERLNRLKEYGDKTGNSLSHYIRKLSWKYLENDLYYYKN
jgi:hypothetical protein